MPRARPVPRKPALLIILDGFGMNPSKVNNAVVEADTPNLDRYFSTHPHTALEASGIGVAADALPYGELTLGALGLQGVELGEQIRVGEVALRLPGDRRVAGEQPFERIPVDVHGIHHATTGPARGLHRARRRRRLCGPPRRRVAGTNARGGGRPCC